MYYTNRIYEKNAQEKPRYIADRIGDIQKLIEPIKGLLFIYYFVCVI